MTSPGRFFLAAATAKPGDPLKRFYESEANAALDVASKALTRLRLSINPYKTRIVSFEQGFRFLGVFFVRNEQYLLSPGASLIR